MYLDDNMRYQDTSTTHIQDLSPSNLAFNNITLFNRSEAVQYRDLGPFFFFFFFFLHQ
jgi:hypothetical protein